MRDWHRRLRQRLAAMLRAHLSPSQVAMAVAIGIFVGVQPIYGLHLPVCIVIARRLALNQAIVYGAANISNPFFAPFLVAAEIAVGEWVRHGKFDPAGADALQGDMFWEFVKEAPDLILSCIVGSQVIGLVLGSVLAGIAFVVMRVRG